MADLGDMLMNQIKQSNLAQTQLATDYSNQANTLAQMPQANPMNDFMGSLSMGVLGAPSHLSTMEAIGQAMPGAQNAFQQTQQQNANRMTQAMEYKRLAASTLSAVAKFNLEYGLKREELGLKHASLEETKRHHEADEYSKMLQHSNKPTQMQELAKKNIEDKLKQGFKALESKGNVNQLLQSAKNSTGWFSRDRSGIEAASKGLPSEYGITSKGDYNSDYARAREIAIQRETDESISDFIQYQKGLGMSDEKIQSELIQKLPKIREVSEQAVNAQLGKKK